MADNTFLGVGMKFPPEIDPITGRIKTADREKSVKESIYLILMTRKTERLVRPLFGSTIDSYTFMDINETNLTMIRYELRDLILGNEPRISDVDINIVPQLAEGRLIIDIVYHIIETNTRDNLVFPFYLDQGIPEVEAEEEYEEDMDDFYEDDADDFD